jgi:hypothetical protein
MFTYGNTKASVNRLISNADSACNTELLQNNDTCVDEIKEGFKSTSTKLKENRKLNITAPSKTLNKVKNLTPTVRSLV